MTKLNLSQYDVADLSKLDRSTVIRILDGKNTPSLRTVEAMCRALNASPGRMLRGE